ncbi:MAG: SO_0444 family Cu/Zn efflux transporter [Candidatus Kapaibacterium sp.]
MITDFLYEIYVLFIEMSPYLMIGLAFVAILNIYMTKEFVKKQIGKDSIWSIFKAALFGVPLPLCSCGVIPTTVYMADSKASKGAVTSFLISTPQTGIDSIIATYGMMGPVFGIFRPISALIMGVVGGLFINATNKDKPLPEKKNLTLNVIAAPPKMAEKTADNPFSVKAKSSLKYAFVDFLDDIVVEFLIGLVIAGAITYFLPTEFLEGTGLKSGILGMLVMILIGVPMYVCATASIPIAVSLILKGFSPGVAFVFLAVGPATNAASIGILSKSLGKRLITYYLFALIVMSIGFGYLLDFVFAYVGINPQEQLATHSHHEHSGLIPYEVQIVLATIFALLVISSLYRKYGAKYFRKTSKVDRREFVMVEGMTCNHCVATVTNAVNKIDGIKDVEVDLSAGKAYYSGDIDKSIVKSAVENCGYNVG